MGLPLQIDVYSRLYLKNYRESRPASYNSLSSDFKLVLQIALQNYKKMNTTAQKILSGDNRVKKELNKMSGPIGGRAFNSVLDLLHY